MASAPPFQPSPVDIGGGSIAPQMQPMDPSSIGPQPQMSGGMSGMFGNVSPWRQALAMGLAGFVARRNPQLLQGLIDQQTQKLRTQQEMAAQANLQNLEFQRQLQLMPYQIQAKMYDSPIAQTLLAQGIRPGDPRWAQAMQTSLQNDLDPVVNAGPYGPVLRSQVANAAAASQPPASPVGKLTPIGGPTPSASGGF